MLRSERNWFIGGVVLALLAVVGVAIIWYVSSHGGLPGQDTYTVERTDYNPPQPPPDDVLVDDRLEDRPVLAFDPALVDRRPLGQHGEWLINASAAVLRLDVPMILPDSEADLLVLYPSYTAAMNLHSESILPSVNLIDGKAKQFDDGLYAALEQMYYQGVQDHFRGHVDLIRTIYEKLPADGPAAAFLAASLTLADVDVPADDPGAANSKDIQKWLRDFESDPTASKPIGFYTWSHELQRTFRFLRFLQHEFAANKSAAPLAIAQAVAEDPTLLADYQKMVRFFSKLTNPPICLSIADLQGMDTLDAAAVVRLAKERHVWHEAIAVVPPATSRETVLFDKLFGDGLPPGVDLMRELVRRIRSGEVDLTPNAESGWYERQAYALETMLLAERGEEHAKLMLTKAYKKRMLEAFQALITKRRETHVRSLDTAKTSESKMPDPLDHIAPRLRLEPCPSYYLRTARAYAFLANFLDSAVTPELMETLHGLKQGGQRSRDLRTELAWMRDLFYGLYLTTAEDIGLAVSLDPDEQVDQDACYTLAGGWLATVFADDDLAADTRVSIPIFVDYQAGTTRLWITLGVRLAKLEASYARPPHLKPAQAEGDWTEAEPYQLRGSQYLIPVDEFAEVQIPGLKVFNREELRAICDREKTKDAILAALRNPK